MTNNKILFYTLAFGNQSYYEQAQLLIISLLRFRCNQLSTIRIYTDNPDFFRLYTDSGVEIFPVDLERLKQIRDMHYGYNFANKLQLITDVVTDSGYSASVFFDTDIVAKKSPENFISQLHTGIPFMYKKERRYCGESTKEYWHALNAIELHPYKIKKSSCQWNSGVVGISQSFSRQISDAMTIMDNLLLAGVKQHTSEQVAISVVLEETGTLQSTTDYFIHYHSNKAGWEVISRTLQQHRERGKNVSELIDWYQSLTSLPPENIEQNPLTKTMSKWINSLKKRIR
ncbi:MAG TPA: hypothetical protein DIT05_00940 [Morganella sp. (in: Bacteria)]|nr:hypothetical protein [Morganella sp. (in: enterobacteria)]